MSKRTFLACILAASCWGGVVTAQPANNDCVNAIAVSVGSPAATGNITTATNDGTATCGASATNRDVWYSFTAPSAGTYQFTTCGTHDAPGIDAGMDTVLSALDACGGVQLACNDDNGAACTGLDVNIFRDSSISVAMTLGQTVVLRVSHFGTVIANGDFMLNVIAAAPEDCANGIDDDFDGLTDCADADCLGDPACAPPVEDECIGATAVALGANFISNINATNSPEPPPIGPCAVFGQNANDVWYSFTAATSDVHGFNTCGIPGFDTDLTLYEGPCGALVELACNGDGTGLVGCQIFYSRLSATLNAGTTYLVRIGGFGALTEGTGTLNIQVAAPEDCADGIDNDLDGLTDCADMADCPSGVAPCIEVCTDGIDNDADGQIDCADADCIGDPSCAPPANDECAGATAVMLGANAISNVNATNSPEPPPVGPCAVFGQNANDVWYSFTASSSVVHQINTCGIPGFDTDITIYEGPCGSLFEVACNGDGVGLVGCQIFYSSLSATLNAGTNYLIRIGGFGAATEGTGTLNIIAAGPEDCTDGFDNDFDGLVDCNDFVDCPAGMAPCIEICNDGIDNDTDGLTDCNDGECAGDANCLAGGNDFCGGALVVMCGDTVMGDTTLATAEPWPTCGTTSGTGGGVWYRFAGNGDQVTLTTCSVGTNYDTKIRVWSGSCSMATCVAGNDDALCAVNGLHSTVAFLTTPGVDYFILVHGFAASQGLFEMTVTCVTPGVEICDDFLDNDLDGLVDCADIDCITFPTCLPPANDECLGASTVMLGANAISNVNATDSPEPPPVGVCNVFGDNGSDVWYSFTAGTTANHTIDTCDPAGWDTDLTVYEGPCGSLIQVGCNGDGVGLTGCQAFYSALNVPLTAGVTYLIRVGSWDDADEGSGTLNIGVDCGNLGAVTCSYDCGTDMVTIDWTDNGLATTGYSILENGVMVGSAGAGASSFTLASPSPGTNTYTVEWACSLGGNGAAGTCTADVQPPILLPGGTTDVILHLEGLQSAGVLGMIDSGMALETALLANGRVVARVAVSDFDVQINSGCLDLTAVQTVWVLTGTFPDDYRISVGEGDALAALAANGVGLYFEANDHWAFLHTVSGLDGRDGVDAAGNLDGDDSFLSMNGANAVIAGLDLSANAGVAYMQDQAGNEFTDQLSVTGGDAPGVTSAEVIWTAAAGGYNTGVIAVHTDGGVMISTSWEFGGYGGDQNALALAYLDALGRTGPVGDQFKRGDCNNDNGFNIADAVFLLGNLFPPPGGMPNVLACRDACDGNNDGGINIADAVAMLGALFPPPGMPSPGLPAPFGACGLDTGMDSLDCLGYNHCP